MGQKPSVGRIVHYHTPGHGSYQVSPPLRPAIITAVNDDGTVALHVFFGDGERHEGIHDAGRLTVPYSEEPKAGHWSWPPRSQP